MDTLAAGFAPELSIRWLGWLRKELAPAHGRWQTTVRMVVTVSLVVIISMALQVPSVALSCYMVFFATKENKVVTTLTGVLAIAGLTIGIGVSLLLYHYVIDYPEIRIPMMAVVLFSGFYFSRVFLIGPLAFTLGFVIAATQSIAELMPSPEYLVHYLLWLWVAVAYPIALTVLVNQLVLPAHPKAELLRELQSRLDLVRGLIARKLSLSAPSAEAGESLQQLATHSDAQLLKLLKFAEMDTPALKERHAGQSIIIMAVGRMVDSAAALALRGSFSPNAEDYRILQILHGEIKRLRDALSQISLPQPPPEARDDTAALPEIQELQRCVSLLRDGISGAWERAAPKHQKRLLAEDAFTNPAHVYFALKVTLAAMLCYIFYTAVDWAGIHTAFITCCFIALESTGATMRKGTLRLTGCLVGALAGFLSTMYLIPRMESVASLVLLVAAVSAVAGWVAAGTERIAYAGLQIALAFYLSILQEFAPSVDFDAIRDRILGIILGITVITLVFHYLWPERATDRLREKLARVLRNIGRLLSTRQHETSLETASVEIRNLRTEITTDIDETLQLAGAALFEDDKAVPHDRISSSTVNAAITRTQRIFLTANLLAADATLVEWQSLSEPAQHAEIQLRKGVAAQLDRVAGFLTNGTLHEEVNIEAQFAMWNRVTASVDGIPHDGLKPLLRHLVAQVEEINGLLKLE